MMYSELLNENFKIYQSGSENKVVFESGIEYNDFEIKTIEFLKTKSSDYVKKIHLLKRKLDIEIVKVSVYEGN